MRKGDSTATAVAATTATTTAAVATTATTAAVATTQLHPMRSLFLIFDNDEKCLFTSKC